MPTNEELTEEFDHKKITALGKKRVDELYKFLNDEMKFLAYHAYDASDAQQARDILINFRNECLGSEFDADGAVILSHAIRWLHFKIEGKPYQEITD